MRRPAPGQRRGSGGSGAGSGGVRTGGASGPVSAAQLAAGQATADADAAPVTVAQQDLANATVLSPVGGTVVAVDVSPGTAVSAGSTAFEVAGLDSYQVVTDVPVTDRPALKVGQRASVQPDGLTRPLMGSVVSIGLTRIPTSAVHYCGHCATVAVYSGGKTHSVKVAVGTKGLVMTRITAGPQGWPAGGAGQPAQPLPTSNLPGQIGPGAVVGPVFQP